MAHGMTSIVKLSEDLFVKLSKVNVESVMIAQWNSSLSVLPVARVQFPATAEYSKGFFPG